MKKELVIFETLDKEISLSVEILKNTVWLTQNQMAELFKTTKQNISLHANNCFKEGELDKKSVVKESLTTAADGKNYKTKLYNLDVIISIGYRVKSKRGVEFRQWANEILKQYILKGYVVNKKRLQALEKTVDIQTKMLANALDVEEADILKAVNEYTDALLLLDQYDHQALKKPSGKMPTYRITYDECVTMMLTYEDTLLVREEVAPLILPESDEVTAVRFDALMYGIELASLVGKKYTSARKDLLKKVSGIAGVANIPEIQAQTELIDQILHTDYVENAGIDEFENIRKNLRDLMKYIPDKSRNKYMTNFTDEILSTEWKEAELENNDLENYKVRVEYYVRQHQDNYVISKLKKNQPLTEKDVAELEKILWSELGTKEDYEAEFGRKPLGEFVREMVGLDMNAAKEAFSKYLEDVNLDSRQIYFVNQIIEYIVHNGMMKDLSVLLESPFTDRGSISEIFTDMGVWLGIKKVIDTINANAAA